MMMTMNDEEKWLAEIILASKLISTNNQLTRVLCALQAGSFIGLDRDEEANIRTGVMFTEGTWYRASIDDSPDMDDKDRLTLDPCSRLEAIADIKLGLMDTERDNSDFREAAVIDHYLDKLIDLQK